MRTNGSERERRHPGLPIIGSEGFGLSETDVISAALTLGQKLTLVASLRGLDLSEAHISGLERLRARVDFLLSDPTRRVDEMAGMYRLCREIGMNLYSIGKVTAVSEISGAILENYPNASDYFPVLERRKWGERLKEELQAELKRREHTQHSNAR